MDEYTLPFILERANDIDSAARKLVYQRFFEESFPICDLPSEEAATKLIIQGIYERYFNIDK